MRLDDARVQINTLISRQDESQTLIERVHALVCGFGVERDELEEALNGMLEVACAQSGVYEAREDDAVRLFVGLWVHAFLMGAFVAGGAC